MPRNIPLTETWHRDTWVNWTTDQSITSDSVLGETGDGGHYNFGLVTQNHIDLRNFNEGANDIVTNCTYTSGFQTLVSGTDTPVYPSTTLYPSLTLYPVENPTVHWPMGQVAITGATTATILSGYAQPIDLTVLGGGNLTMALYKFPLANVDLTNSYIDLSSDGFNDTICSLPWNTSTTTPIAGNSTLTFPYTALTGIDLTAVTGVRFRITATGSCTMIMLALRLIVPNWVATNVDFDNLSGTLRQCIPLDANPAEIAVSANKDLPILWRADNPSSVDDPRPINAEVGVIFNSGSQVARNSISLYMRGNSSPHALQADLQGVPQSSLTGQTPPALGLPILPRNRWVSFTVDWGVTNLIAITNASNPLGYQWSSGWTLANSSTYLMVCSLVENTARLAIWGLDSTTLAPTTLVFDSTAIPDMALFSREAGRIGLQAALGDGDSYVGPVRPRSLTFAEYRSAPLQSITPVRGAQLFVTSAPATELFQTTSTVAGSGWNVINTNPQPLISIDPQRYNPTSVDYQSTQVTFTNMSTSPQGIISNHLTPIDDSLSGITNFDNLDIEMSLWIPQDALASANPAITLALISDKGNVLPIAIPVTTGNEWQEFEIRRPIAALPIYPVSGQYQLALYYHGTVPTSIWIDNVSVHEHAVRWDVRSVTDDPWSSNDAPWTELTDIVGGQYDGARFITPGTELQLRSQALRQDASVFSPPNLVPQYAHLGRLVWPENAPTLTPPTATFSFSNTGRQYTFNGTASSGSTPIGDWYWDFGDGAYASGPVVSYTYPAWIASGTYTITLIVTDRAGSVAQTSTPITL